MCKNLFHSYFFFVNINYKDRLWNNNKIDNKFTEPFSELLLINKKVKSIGIHSTLLKDIEKYQVTIYQRGLLSFCLIKNLYQS